MQSELRFASSTRQEKLGVAGRFAKILRLRFARDVLFGVVSRFYAEIMVSLDL